MKWRPVIIAVLACAVSAVIVLWVIHFRQAGYWLQVHTGTINEPGPYYGFWSGFGSDIEEFGILGAIGAGIYQLVKKYNCHEPGCWRIGQHSAAGGQFLLCYRRLRLHQILLGAAVLRRADEPATRLARSEAR